MTYVTVVSKVAIMVAIPLKHEIPGQSKVIPGSRDKLLKSVKSLDYPGHPWTVGNPGLHQNPGIFFILTLKAFAFPFQKQEGHLFHHSEFKLSFRKMRRNFLLKQISSQIPKSVRHMFIKGTQFRVTIEGIATPALYICFCFTFFMRLT